MTISLKKINVSKEYFKFTKKKCRKAITVNETFETGYSLTSNEALV